MKKVTIKDKKDLVNKFKSKISMEDANKHYLQIKDFFHYSKKEKGDERLWKSCLEIMNLINLSKYLSSTHMSWTGDPSDGKSYDGILYTDNEELKVEISNLVDEKKIISLRKTGRHRIGYRRITEITKNINIDKENLENYKNIMKSRSKYLEMEEDFIEDIIFQKIKTIFENKNKRKYQDCYLVIFYASELTFRLLKDKDVKKYIFSKLETEEKELLSDIRKIFKKIIFLPFENYLPKEEKHLPFIFNKCWYINGFQYIYH